MINRIVDFIWDNYVYFHTKVTKEQIKELLKNYSNQIVVIEEKSKIKGIAFYLKLTKETLDRIKDKTLNIADDKDKIKELLQEKGNNVHFIFLVANGVKTIMLGLKAVIKRENPESISWFSPDMKNLFIKKIMEVELCHQ